VLDEVFPETRQSQAALAAADTSTDTGLLSAAVRLGYLPRYELLDQVLNRAAAGVLLALSLPLFLVIVALQKVTSPGDVFYRGPRYGKNKEIFLIYKFRTLEPSAVRLTSDRTLPRRAGLETPLGLYLRSTRLDELPQLINVVRGDMVLFGPRPIRPEMELKYQRDSPGYEVRFRVRPGLVGLAQALMSHETPKSIRSRLTNACCRSHINYGWTALFLARTAASIAWKTAHTATTAILDVFTPTGCQRWLAAGFARPRDGRFEAAADSLRITGALCGISDDVLQFIATHQIGRAHV